MNYSIVEKTTNTITITFPEVNSWFESRQSEGFNLNTTEESLEQDVQEELMKWEKALAIFKSKKCDDFSEEVSEMQRILQSLE